MSAKLIKETDHGLALVSGAEPSWWSDDNLMRGFPSPARVRAWWEEDNLPPDGNFRNRQNTRNHRNTRNTGNHPAHGEKRIGDTYQENDHRDDHDHTEIRRNDSRNGDSRAIPDGGITGNGLDKLKTGDSHDVISGIPMILGSADSENDVPELTAEEVSTELKRAGSGSALALKTYLEKPTTENLKWLAKAALHAKGIKTAGWERHASTVEEVAGDPNNHPLDCECEECI